jgi:hypothetical protein
MRGHWTIFGLKLQLDENKTLEGRCDRKTSHYRSKLFFVRSRFVYDVEILQKRKKLTAQKRERLPYKGINIKRHHK